MINISKTKLTTCLFFLDFSGAVLFNEILDFALLVGFGTGGWIAAVVLAAKAFELRSGPEGSWS
jgi:hypothetical protein